MIHCSLSYDGKYNVCVTVRKKASSETCSKLPFSQPASVCKYLNSSMDTNGWLNSCIKLQS